MVVSLLEKESAGWAIVTNGKVWRLYSKNAHSRATNYYEIDLEEVLAQTGPAASAPAEAFRYFWLLFRSDAFVPTAVEREGKTLALNLLDRLLLDSQDYARELGDRLKERVFEQVFHHLAEGFVAHIRERDGAERRLDQQELDRIFVATLTLLYRLLFLLYAEARDLLPTKEVRGYFEKSLTKLRTEVGEAAGTIEDVAESRLRKHFRKDSYALYERLRNLFAVIDRGAGAVNVPVYNGGLFITNADKADDSSDAAIARFLDTTFVGDSFLACAIDLLARDPDPKTQALVFIDYKSLGVRQLGSIYEGLLEFKLRIAPEKMAIVKGKKTEEVVPYAQAQRDSRTVLKKGRGKDAAERGYRKGEVYLENDKHERKASGSYYTPDHIVEYIVHYAVGPVLDAKFEEMRSHIRQAQQRRRERESARVKKAEELRRLRLPVPHQFPAGDSDDEKLVDELFRIRVLDPAMGSGHFLVETVDYITDRILDFLNGFPGNPVATHLERMRATILDEMDRQDIAIDRKQLTDVNLLKRFVLKRCIYGVDLNPMAVELAKVSLWLDCFTLGAPLSFLDHHLRCGNSLVGVTVQEVQDIEKGQLSLLSGNKFEGMKQAVQGMINVGALADLTSTQIKESRREYRRASGEMAPAKRLLDLYTSQWFGNAPTKGNKKAKQPARNHVLEFLRDAASERWAEKPGKTSLDVEWIDIASRAVAAAMDKRFFHWELEFPEVFYGPRPGTTTVIDRLDDGGFDAVIGNPPYDVLASEELGYEVEPDLSFFDGQNCYEHAIRGKSNLYKLFLCRAGSLLRPHATLSFIIPMALLGDDQAAGVRRNILTNQRLMQAEAFPQKDVPENRVFREAKLSTVVIVSSKESPRGSFTFGLTVVG